MAPLREMGCALLLTGALLWHAGAAPEPIHIRDAAGYEGQTVAMAGWPSDVKSGDDWTRFVLSLDGHAISVRADEALEVPMELVEVTGQVVRSNGHLTIAATQVTWNR